MTEQAIEDGADLRELENMAASLEAEQAPPPPPEDDTAQASISPEMQAYGMARMICEVAAKGAQIRWNCLTYSDDIKDQGAQVLVPLFLKYDIQNEFLAKYAEEFAAGAFFAGIIYTSYAKVKAHEAEQAKKTAKETTESAADA